MERISKQIELDLSPDQAFQKFVLEFNNWWPKEYTWSQDKLKEIKIEEKENGACTEIGPRGFRCDWGRVTNLVKNKHIQFTWQISPHRVPVPDPEKASEVKVEFIRSGAFTLLKFEHSKFENHGDGAENYKGIMDGEHGWDYILDSYKNYCERQ